MCVCIVLLLGDTIVLGDAVTIGYVGKIAATGVQFEAAKQFSFVVGAKEVCVYGIVCMCVCAASDYDCAVSCIFNFVL